MSSTQPKPQPPQGAETQDLALAESSGHGHAREKLLQAAAELFAARGFDQVSIREIAARAGVRHGGVNYHFKGKQELYLEVIQRFGPRGNHVSQGGHPDLHAAFHVRGADAAKRTLAQLVRDHLAAMVEASHPITAGLLEQEMRRPEGPSDQIFENAILLRHRAIEHLLQEIAPSLTDPEELRLHSLSLTSNTVIFMLARPVALRLVGSDRNQGLRPDHLDRIADHILRTALAALPQD